MPMRPSISCMTSGSSKTLQCVSRPFAGNSISPVRFSLAQERLRNTFLENESHRRGRSRVQGRRARAVRSAHRPFHALMGRVPCLSDLTCVFCAFDDTAGRCLHFSLPRTRSTALMCMSACSACVSFASDNVGQCYPQWGEPPMIVSEERQALPATRTRTRVPPLASLYTRAGTFQL